MEETQNPVAEKRKEENKKANAEVTKLVDSIVNKPLNPVVNIPEVGKSDGGLSELLMKHKSEFTAGTVKFLPAYEREIEAIGVVLRNLAPLDHETRTRVLSYAMQWVDDQKQPVTS